jgi:hypothetical protein
MAQGKKRVGNVKAAAKRARSWNKNQAAKKERVAEQEKRHAHNVEVGSTGKQRANLAVKQAKRIDESLK